ncbi:MAG: hypothetical protein WBQ85_03265 [Candidatus Sulfotelmatobacter sp.]
MRMLSAPVCVLMLLSCGGNADPASTGVLSANWQFSLQQSPPSTNTLAESGFLIQSGGSLTGSLVLSNQAVCPGLGPALGTLNGNNVALRVTQAGQTVAFTGTAANDGSAMTGTYSILASGCSGGTSTGTWTASPVKPVTGTYQATFTSGTLGVYNSTITVTQGPNTGASIANLSGTMTSSNSGCANNLSIAGVVSGTAIVFNFLAADGSAVGQFTGTTSTDATTLTGTYDFLAEGNVCPGDAGSISVTQQAPST